MSIDSQVTVDNPVVFRFLYGSYKGCTLQEAPKSYLQWFLENRAGSEYTMQVISKHLEVPYTPKARPESYKPLTSTLKTMPYGEYAGREFGMLPKEYIRGFLLSSKDCTNPETSEICSAMWEIVNRRRDDFNYMRVGKRNKPAKPELIPLRPAVLQP